MLRQFCGKFVGIARIRDWETRRAAKDEKPPPVMMVTSARHVGRYGGVRLGRRDGLCSKGSR